MAGNFERTKEREKFPEELPRRQRRKIKQGEDDNVYKRTIIAEYWKLFLS